MNNNYMSTIEDLVKQSINLVYDHRNKNPDAENLAIVFDIDGTLLNNNVPIRPVVEFYNICKDLGYHLFIVTARDSQGVNETVDQLNDLKIVDYISLYFRIPTYWDMHKYKETCRQSIAAKGYDIFLSIGDSEWDVGKYGGHGVLLPQHESNM